jgi:hypothetical protein
LPSSGAVALSNNAPPHDKNNPPPEGLSWGDGELKGRKRQRALSPDVKGVFTESVIARLPEVQVEEDAVAQLFASDARMPAPSLTPPAAARPNAFWHEPGNALQAGAPPQPGKPRAQPTPAAAAALIAGASAPRASADKRPPVPGSPAPRLPAGALGGPVAAEGSPVTPTPARSNRRDSLPAGALRDGRTAKQASPPHHAAAQEEVPLQGERTIELGDNAPSGLDLDIPAANTNASRARTGVPAPRGRPQIHAVIDKDALGGGTMRAGPGPSLRAGGGASSNQGGSASPDAAGLPASGSGVASSMRASAPHTELGASLRAAADALAESSGARASSAQSDVRASLRPSGIANSPSSSRQLDEPITASRASRAPSTTGPTSLRPGGGPPPLPHAAEPHVQLDDAQHAMEAGADTSSFPPTATGSMRPKSGKERRAEARRAARRKAAKHLPPPPPAARKPVWDPARITLVSFAAVLGIGALGIGAAEAGLWELPPQAAAMLGIENAQASLSQAKPSEKAHLVMPAEPRNAPAPAPRAAVPEPPRSAGEQQSPGRVAPASVPVAAAQPTAAAEPAEAAKPAPAANGELRLNPPPGAVADYSSAPAAWQMVPDEEVPAPLMQFEADSSADDEPAPAPSAATAPAPTAATTDAPAAPSAPAKLAPTPGTISASAAAPPKVAPEAAAELEDVADESSSAATPGDRAVSAKLVALARTKLKARDAAGAAELMLRQVTKDPEDHHAMEVLIRAWIAMGRGDDAVGYAELIVKKRPRRAGYRVLEGDARLAAGDAAGAQVAWRVALQLEPDNVEAKRRLGIQ